MRKKLLPIFLFLVIVVLMVFLYLNWRDLKAGFSQGLSESTK